MINLYEEGRKEGIRIGFYGGIITALVIGLGYLGIVFLFAQ